jgi:hypothetical protein
VSVVPGGHPLGLQYRVSVVPRGVKGALRDSGAAEGTGWPVWGGPAGGRRLRVLALRPLTPLVRWLPAGASPSRGRSLRSFRPRVQAFELGLKPGHDDLGAGRRRVRDGGVTIDGGGGGL